MCCSECVELSNDGPIHHNTVGPFSHLLYLLMIPLAVRVVSFLMLCQIGTSLCLLFFLTRCNNTIDAAPVLFPGQTHLLKGIFALVGSYLLFKPKGQAASMKVNTKIGQVLVKSTAALAHSLKSNATHSLESLLHLGGHQGVHEHAVWGSITCHPSSL